METPSLMSETKKRVVFATPTIDRPHPAYLAAMEACIPALEAAGIEHLLTIETGNPYISAARATMLRKAMDGKADEVVFIDHDMSWRPDDIVKLIKTPGEVVAGLYRFKKDEEEYMGSLIFDAEGRPTGRHADETETLVLNASRIPAGFMKITKEAVDRFMKAYPELCYGPRYSQSVDLFNHGAHDGVWWGEDYAFSRRWIEAGGELLVIPDLELTHHGADREFPGNLHQYLMRRPGGALAQQSDADERRNTEA